MNEPMKALFTLQNTRNSMSNDYFNRGDLTVIMTKPFTNFFVLYYHFTKKIKCCGHLFTSGSNFKLYIF